MTESHVQDNRISMKSGRLEYVNRTGYIKEMCMRVSPHPRQPSIINNPTFCPTLYIALTSPHTATSSHSLYITSNKTRPKRIHHPRRPPRCSPRPTILMPPRLPYTRAPRHANPQRHRRGRRVLGVDPVHRTA